MTTPAPALSPGPGPGPGSGPGSGSGSGPGERGGARAGRTPGWIALAVGLLLLVTLTFVGKLVRAHGPVATGELEFDIGLSKRRDLIGIVLSESVSTILGPLVLPLLVIGGCVVLWQHHLRRIAVLLVALSASGWLASGIVKLLVRRDRPPTDVVNAVLLESASDSFPSGHTALVAAVFAAAVVIAWMLGYSALRQLWITLAGALAVLAVGVSRLYLGVHYFYDVLAAPLVAVGGVLVAAYVLPRVILLLERHLPDDPNRPPRVGHPTAQRRPRSGS